MDLEQNEKIMQQYLEDKEMKFVRENSVSVEGKTILNYSNLFTLDRKQICVKARDMI